MTGLVKLLWPEQGGNKYVDDRLKIISRTKMFYFDSDFTEICSDESTGNS